MFWWRCHDMVGYTGTIMAKMTREVCDICKNPRRKIKPYRVGQDGLLVDVVLCREDSEYLDRLIELGQVVPFSSNKVKVWTIDEILRRKKEQKKAATDQ